MIPLPYAPLNRADVRAFLVPRGGGFPPPLRTRDSHLAPAACPQLGAVPSRLTAQVCFSHSARPCTWGLAVCVLIVPDLFPSKSVCGSVLCVATGQPCPGLYLLPPCASAAVNGPVLRLLGHQMVPPEEAREHWSTRALRPATAGVALLPARPSQQWRVSSGCSMSSLTPGVPAGLSFCSVTRGV